MFERFTDTARNVVTQAQQDARRLGHNHIGCEHLLLAVAAADEPAGAVLRDHNVTPERIQATLLSTTGPLGGLDEEALASIGIDLDAVRTKIEAAFGPDALTRPLPAAGHSRRPAWGKGPLAELKRRRHRRRAASYATRPAGPRNDTPQAAGPSNETQQAAGPRGSAQVPPGPAPRGHIPFTPRAKKTLELSLREARALQDGSIGVQHVTLALLIPKDGTVPRILAALDVPPAALRAAILARYRKAS